METWKVLVVVLGVAVVNLHVASVASAVETEPLLSFDSDIRDYQGSGDLSTVPAAAWSNDSVSLYVTNYSGSSTVWLQVQDTFMQRYNGSWVLDIAFQSYPDHYYVLRSPDAANLSVEAFETNPAEVNSSIQKYRDLWLENVSTVQELREKVDRLEVEVDGLEGNLSESRDTVSMLRGKVNRLRNEVYALEANESTWQNQSATAQELRDEVDRLESVLAEKNATIQGLKQGPSTDFLENQLQDKQKEISRLRSKVGNLSGELENSSPPGPGSGSGSWLPALPSLSMLRTYWPLVLIVVGGAYLAVSRLRHRGVTPRDLLDAVPLDALSAEEDPLDKLRKGVCPGCGNESARDVKIDPVTPSESTWSCRVCEDEEEGGRG